MNVDTKIDTKTVMALSFKTSKCYRPLAMCGSSHFQSFVFEIQTNGHVTGTTAVI
jgi:hypothetical protein